MKGYSSLMNMTSDLGSGFQQKMSESNKTELDICQLALII